MRSQIKRFIGKFNLRHKVFILFSLQIVFLMFFVFYYGQGLILDRMVRLEQNTSKQEVTRVVGHLDLELSYVSKLAKNLSSWDDMYYYVDRPTVDFENHNISYSGMENQGLSAIVVINNSGKIVREYGYDYIKKKEMIIPREFSRYTTKDNLSYFKNNNKIESGIIHTESGLMVVSAQPILKTDGTGKKNGYVIVGRILDNGKIKEALPKFTIENNPVHQNGTKVKISDVNQTEILKGAKVQIDNVSTGKQRFIEGYAVIPDLLTGKPLYLDIEHRNSLSGNIQLFNLIFFGIIMVFVLFFVINWVFFNRNLLGRITQILNSISMFSSSGHREAAASKDELVLVEQKIDIILEQLNSSYHLLIQQANMDQLTGLYNRYGLMREIELYINKNEKNVRAALLFIDIDRFKNINDIYGHRIGDEVLSQISNRIRQCVPEDSLLARISGDEYIVFIRNYNTKLEIQTFSQELKEKLSQVYNVDGYFIFSSASIGISFYPDDSDDMDIIINHADLAMNNAKKKGRNNIVQYQYDMRSRISEVSIRDGMNKNEFYVVYQPQVHVREQELFGAEALMRWKHPQYGMISPLEFINVAEDTGMIHELGQWIIEMVCKQVKEWEAQELSVPKVSINISPVQLHRGTFYEYVEKTLKYYKVNPASIAFEITETFAIGAEQHILNNLRSLNEMGINIYIDDFGKEYSVLSYLEQLPIKGLKIDKCFVDRVETNDKVIKMIVALGKTLGLDIIVEGVESLPQEKKVAKMGCSIIQGFLYSKPLLPDEMNAFVSELKEVKNKIIQ